MEKKIADFDRLTHREESDAEKYGLRGHLFGREDIYPMWVADMEFEAAAVIVEALQKRVDHRVFGYAVAESALFESAAGWYDKRHGLKISAEELRASPSIMTTMSAAIDALSNTGEGVTTLVPVYPPFMEAVTTQERVLHTVALIDDGSGFVIDYEALETALKQSKILLLCNPHNPVGRVWRVEELKMIAALCEKHQISIISDDAHADLLMPGSSYHSITTVSGYAKSNCVTLFGPGKGFNISGLSSTFWFSFSKEILARIDKRFKARHIVSGQLMGYHATMAAYKEGETWLDELLPYLEHNLSYATQRLSALGFKLYKPEGTYLLWINCKGLGLSDLKLKDFFVNKAKLGLSMGRFFGSSGQGYVRMNCAVPFTKLQAALASIEEALGELEALS